MRRSAIVIALLGTAHVAHASDVPAYAPPPAWVKPAPAIDATALTDGSPLLLRFDNQQRVEDGGVWSYQDIVTRAATAQQLSEIGDIRLQWQPAHGDLVIHAVEILRGRERIDLLAGKKPFTVLRREPGLDQRMLDGVLTATMASEGLAVGDVLRVSFSTTRKDPTLKGNVQSVAPVLAAPMQAGFARTRLSWPEASEIKWRSYAEGSSPKPVVAGGWREIEFAVPLPKPAELPNDAPMRFARPPILELTSFADWPAVSMALAPLYATDGLIAPGSPLAAEVATIAAAEKEPVRRAAAALRLVQDKVRYLLLGMDTGNYVPQTPAETWSRRYGDCKAKTLLLLAILRDLGIEAEPVAANLQFGELVPERLPGLAAFDHVLVRATIAGRSYWLEGTGSGTRLADIGDTPRLGSVLPLRMQGAGLMPVELRPDARPDVTVAIDLDDRAGIDTPTLVKAAVTIRGAMAEKIGTAAAQATPEQRQEMADRLLGEHVGSGEYVDPKIVWNAEDGIVTLTATGITSTRWRRQNRRWRLVLDTAVGKLDFKPDRTRAAWQAIPVALPGPAAIVYRTTFRLPDGGRDFALEGDRVLPATLAGSRLGRTLTLAGDTVTVEDRIEQVGGEIAVADLPAARAALAQARNRLATLVAPAGDAGTAAYYDAARRRGATKPVDAMFARVTAARAKDADGWMWSARFRASTGDRPGAIAAYGGAIAAGATPALHLRRAALHAAAGDEAKQLADIEAARALDPEDDAALDALAEYQARRGKAEAAMTLIDARLERAGARDRAGWLMRKAELQHEAGRRDDALATLDTAIADLPGRADLLNARCWTRGTGNVALEAALRDCTRAIELADNTSAILDSRAMVYFRLGRLEEAMADLDAALEMAPDQSASRYLRGIVLHRAGRKAEGDAELARARLGSPRIDEDYARWGIRSGA